MRLRSAALLVLVAGVLTRQAGAAAPADRARVQALLNAMETDVRAVRNGLLPPDGIVRAANEIRGYVTQISPALDGSAALSIGAAMREHADALNTLANDPNPIETAGPAADLLTDIARLRATLAAP